MRDNDNNRNLNKKTDLDKQSRQYNEEFARANALIRNQNPYDQEFAAENEGSLKYTRNANTRGRRQGDALNLECADDNEFKAMRKRNNDVEFATDQDFTDCKYCKNDKCDCE